MNSGTDGKTAEKLMKKLNSAVCLAHITNLPSDLTLPEATSDHLNYIDAIVKRAAIHKKASISRITKILSRKRPHLIPMLDTILQGFLGKVWRFWKQDDNQINWNWFCPIEAKWTNTIQTSPYLLIIQRCLSHGNTIQVLSEIRDSLSNDVSFRIPPNASLLRIWESIVFQYCQSNL